MVQLNASLSIPNYDVENTGTPGPPGEDGKTTYVHIAYANDPTGSLDFSTTDPTGRAYVGMYTDFEILDSSDPTKYKWQKVEGEKGEQGDQGDKGDDGLTMNFYQAWANSPDGTIGFSTTQSNNKGYLGTYASTETTQSQDPARYKWTELVGSLVIDSTNYALESRFNWRPAVVYQTVSSYTIPLSQVIPAGTKIQASSEYYWLSGNKPTVDGVRILMLTTDGNSSAGVETNLTTAPDSGKIEMSGTLTADAGFIRVYNGSAGKGADNRYQFENIVVNIGDRLCPWQPNVRDKTMLNNLLTNSTWQLGGGNWQYNVNEWEIISPEPDKPQSNIARSKVTTSTTKQLYQNPHPVKVRAGQIIVVSFDYKESAEVSHFFTVRNFIAQDTPNGDANSQEVWSAKRSEIEKANAQGWSRVTMRFVTTKDGFLDFLPYNNSTTATNSFREIMVTTSGSLQGAYSWYQPDYTSESVNEATQVIPHVYVQSLTPTNVKDGDQWWKMTNNEVTNFYVWGNGQWNEQTIEQSVLNIQTLNAVTINGSTISGSEFINNWIIDIPADDVNPYPQRDTGYTKLADGKLSQLNTHSMKMVDDYIDTLTQETTLEKGVLINKAIGYSPSGDFGYHREARYDNGGFEFTDYTQGGTPTAQARLTPTDGLYVSNALEGGTSGVLPTGPYYQPSAIGTVNSGQTPMIVTFGTGANLTNSSATLARIPFGANPSYGWGTDPNNCPIEVVYPTNNYVFRITRKCKLYIQYGLRVQGNGAANGADYVYSGFSWGDTIEATNTDANSHVIMWGADTGDTSLNLQHATMAAGYYAFSAGTYLAIVRSIRSGRVLMNCTGQFIRFEEMYN